MYHPFRESRESTKKGKKNHGLAMAKSGKMA